MKADVIIIGGGINGCGIARDLSLRGISCVLLEREDFGGATTWNSTKLIHGGLRYLEHMEFSLVRESLRERKLLFRNAPHLVHPLPFFLPVYADSPHSMLKLWLGMKVYDLFALGKARVKRVTKKKMLQHFSLREEGLLGGFTYVDGQVLFPDRLCLENALEAKELGARVFNHARVTGIKKDSSNADGLWHITANVGASTKSKKTFSAPIVINASGPWVDEIRDVLGKKKPLLGGTKGIHLVTKKIVEKAVYLSTKDGRMFFVLPLGAYSLIGTTDTPITTSVDSTRVTKDDVQYLLNQLQENLPQVILKESDIYFTYVGVRPLAKADGPVSSRSRKHIVVNEDNVLSVVGGKLTTFRKISKNVVDMVCSLRGEKRRCLTATTPLIGAREKTSSKERDALAKHYKLSLSSVSYLFHLYGSRAKTLLEQTKSSGHKQIYPRMPHLKCQIQFALEKEEAQTLADVLRRLGLFPQSQLPTSFVKEVLQLCAQFGKWSKKRLSDEERWYKSTLSSALRPVSNSHLAK